QRHPDSVTHQRDEYQQDNEADQDGDEEFHASKLVTTTPKALDTLAQGNTLGPRTAATVFR
ncbi:MAG TPA: hypothetical protein VGK77_17700, partial [Candidatus Binatia bacterium]